jgi:hypothetical protein
LTPPSARKPLPTPTTRTRWPLTEAASPTRTPLVDIGTVHDHRVRLRQPHALLRRDDARVGHGIGPRIDAGDIDRLAAASARAAPIGIDPLEWLDPHHLRSIRRCISTSGSMARPQADALGPGIADPQIGRRAGDVDAGAAEDAQHQRCLEQLEQAGKSHRQHRRQEPAPFVQQRLAGQRDHQRTASASAAVDGNGAPPNALYKPTNARSRASVVSMPARSDCDSPLRLDPIGRCRQPQPHGCPAPAAP